ncbi:F-box protein At3g08750-like [Brassica rapa]|uniref:F-box protein At3g08750 n=1 Tax=Brassica campestris TaxID=3711 RepID=UPI00142DDA7E|nr:F-box protein At3g08750 [Brassica rapa]XP_033145636.1 F-box protein At3g08750 [Brassica rapa]XP_033145637.1 F-box protein At3g08750 [Brassica rapa]XP_033145638.1 F-box protein At3g08750 [Brassica rapa]XP_033145639.1 F-box protein At3g08750-like [Brassica rapa]XP_033145640.1 F-box protein At3g08750-like [Brassica rapa]
MVGKIVLETGDILSPPKPDESSRKMVTSESQAADDLKAKGDMLKDSSGDLIGNEESVVSEKPDESSRKMATSESQAADDLKAKGDMLKDSSGDLIGNEDSVVSEKNIPQDLIELILQRLPVKSIFRFKLTCKDWRSLSTLPRFIYKHLQVSQRRLFLHIRGSQVWQLDLETATYSRIQDFGEEIGSISHCDGLVLLSTSCYEPSTKTLSRRIAIWSCSHGECAWIPRIGLSFYDFYCLGRDSKKSYKVLRFTHGRHDQGDFEAEAEAELYDLDSHRWKTVEIIDDWITHGNGNFGVVSVETSSYWVAATEGKYFVQSFDFTAECFRAITLPKAVALSGGKTLALSPFEHQKLSILCQIADKTELWITQVGDVVNWERFLVFRGHQLIPHNPAFLIMEKMVKVFCEEVTVDRSFAKIKIRQIGQGGFEDTQIAQYRFDRPTRSCLYTESLVPLP